MLGIQLEPAPTAPLKYETVELDASDVAVPHFEMSTPMLVMPFVRFKQQGRIFKSVAAWRTEAFRNGWLLEYARVVGGTGKLVGGKLNGTLEVAARKISIFSSHTVRQTQNPQPSPMGDSCDLACCQWWDRLFMDETNDPTNP